MPFCCMNSLNSWLVNIRLLSVPRVRQPVDCKHLPEFVYGCEGCNVAREMGFYSFGVCIHHYHKHLMLKGASKVQMWP